MSCPRKLLSVEPGRVPATGCPLSVGAAIPDSERFANDDAATRLRESLGDAAFAAAWETGLALTQEQAVAEALAWADAAI